MSRKWRNPVLVGVGAILTWWTYQSFFGIVPHRRTPHPSASVVLGQVHTLTEDDLNIKAVPLLFGGGDHKPLLALWATFAAIHERNFSIRFALLPQPFRSRNEQPTFFDPHALVVGELAAQMDRSGRLWLMWVANTRSGHFAVMSTSIEEGVTQWSNPQGRELRGQIL